jgi:hypothetical protein
MSSTNKLARNVIPSSEGHGHGGTPQRTPTNAGRGGGNQVRGSGSGVNKPPTPTSAATSRNTPVPPVSRLYAATPQHTTPTSFRSNVTPQGGRQ